MEMMEDIRKHVSDYDDEEEIAAYLEKILNREAFDGKGLIYGIGHAIYTLSDPRERIFKSYVEYLAEEKGRQEDLKLCFLHSWHALIPETK
jgi:citrate synthase